MTLIPIPTDCTDGCMLKAHATVLRAPVAECQDPDQMQKLRSLWAARISTPCTLICDCYGQRQQNAEAACN